MSLMHNINHCKALFNQTIDLVLLRLQILSFDVADQAGSFVKIFAAVALSAVLFLLGVISLLFGLNSTLSAEAKLWVFFGIAAVCLVAIISLLAWIATAWRNKGMQVANTLRDMQEDIACLRGRSSQSSGQSTQGKQT